MSTVGDRIRKTRESLGISQIELAKKIHVSKQTMYKYETNIVTNIPVDKIELASKYLNVSPSYLMGWDDNLAAAKTNFSSLIPTIVSDEMLMDHVQKMIKLLPEHKNTVYDNIDYLYEKEGH